MTRHSFLETFEITNVEAVIAKGSAEEVEQSSSTAFEAGYTSGWDDAMASGKNSRLHLEAEFERNIQNLVFTFAEAITHVRSELVPLITALVEQFLPKTAPSSLRSHLQNEILKYSDDILDQPIEIITSTNCKKAIEDMLKKDFSNEFKIIEDSSLSESQVFVRFERNEVEINLDSLIKATSRQLANLQSAHT